MLIALANRAKYIIQELFVEETKTSKGETLEMRDSKKAVDQAGTVSDGCHNGLSQFMTNQIQTMSGPLEPGVMDGETWLPLPCASTKKTLFCNHLDSAVFELDVD